MRSCSAATSADMMTRCCSLGFTFVFFDFVQTVWGRVIVRLPAPRRPAGRDADRGRRVLDLPAVPDRPRLRHRAAAVAVSRAQPRRRQVRGVDDAAMAAGLGANVPLPFTAIFGAGVALAALGGVAAGPVLGLYPGMDTEILIPAFIVIVIGGTGKPARRLRRQSADRARHLRQGHLPSLALFLIYLVMAAVLLVRPQARPASNIPACPRRRRSPR